MEATAELGNYTIDDEDDESSQSQHNEKNNIPTSVTTSALGTEPPRPTVRRRRRRRYKGGFATSLCQAFQQNSTNRTDCCIFACCGTLLSDRMTYLLTSTDPTSWWKRLGWGIAFPFFIFYLLSAYVISEDAWVNGGGTAVLLGITVYYVVLVVYGFQKRAQMRMEVIGKLYELDKRERGETTTEEEVKLYQQRFHGDSIRVNRLFGCYPIIEPQDEEELEDDTDIDAPPRQRGQEGQDLCSCIWNCLAKLCCASWCECWLQCCGMCAVGQEEREMQSIVGKEAMAIDFITFQPFAEYTPKLENLRTTLNTNLWNHYQSLSKLSFQLLKSLGLAVLLLFLYALSDVDSNFTITNMLVLLATFFQAFFILFFVHWKWKKFDLSLDAVVKYFASGFLLSTAMALVFEGILSLLVELISILVIFSQVSEKEVEGDDPDDLVIDLVLRHPGVYIFIFFLNSFMVAALVEEIVKYFGYWMVVHPDLMAVDDMIMLGEGEESDVTASLVEVPPCSGDADQEAEEDEYIVGGDDDDDENIQNGARGVMQQQQSSSLPARGLNSLGDGITVAMVAVALGFACCENLIYIFVYTPPSPGLEISTLLVRSIFPIHPICAAIQSINVCQRDLEKQHHIQLGKIIFPSLILHGTYDFALMVMAFMDAYNKLKEGEDPMAEYKEEEAWSMDMLWQLLPSLSVGFAIMLVGLVYYAVRSRAQRARLNALEIGAGTALIGDTSLV